MRRRHLAPVSSLLAIVALVLSCIITNAAERRVEVTLALICDIYEMKEQNGRGGFARLASALNQIRSGTKNVIVAHAGDAISPSLYSGFDRGAHIIDLTNRLGIDVFVPGNHEFDFGEDIYLKRMSEARFPILAANLRAADGSRLPGHADVKHFTFDGVRVAVIGLTADDSPTKSRPGRLRFEKTVPLARKLAGEQRKAGADIVVAVVHANRRQDIRLFYSEALDVLLSGDDHDLAVLYNGKTAMAEAMVEGEFVTTIDMAIDVSEKDGNRRISWRPRFRIIDTADVAPDVAVAARVADYQREMSKALDVPLGVTKTAMDSRKTTVRTRESTIGNLITDAMRTHMRADVALMNGGGIRGDRLYPAGTTLTRRDVLSELPFRNKVFTVHMKGADLRKALENGLWFAGRPYGRFAHVSGLRLRARADAVPGRRITSVTVAGKPLDPGADYTVATNDFIFEGKEGYDVFKQARPLIGPTDAPLLTNVVMSYIRASKTIAPAIERRIVIE